MTECRWSGWPGAYCLDCGREDPREVALARGEISFDCRLPPGECRCDEAGKWLPCPNFGPIYDGPTFDLSCPKS